MMLLATVVLYKLTLSVFLSYNVEYLNPVYLASVSLVVVGIARLGRGAPSAVGSEESAACVM